LKIFADQVPGLEVVASPLQSNPAGVPDTLSSITSLIGQAQSTLDIQVYQYSTTPYSKQGPLWTVLDDAVRAAAARGVQVRLMVDATVLSSASKKEILALAQLDNVQVKAITIPEWSGGKLQYARLIHSKYFVIDGGAMSWIGSENWIDSYFTNTRNVGFTLTDTSAGAQIEQIYENVWSSAYGAVVK
jgi:phosphatidylserine/phosphatidylglycerophosphate/cardiolipin synthase-like enzyme